MSGEAGIIPKPLIIGGSPVSDTNRVPVKGIITSFTDWITLTLDTTPDYSQFDRMGPVETFPAPLVDGGQLGAVFIINEDSNIVNFSADFLFFQDSLTVTGSDNDMLQMSAANFKLWVATAQLRACHWSRTLNYNFAVVPIYGDPINSIESSGDIDMVTQAQENDLAVQNDTDVQVRIAIFKD